MPMIPGRRRPSCTTRRKRAWWAWQSAIALLLALVALGLTGVFAWRHVLLARELEAALERAQRYEQLAARDFVELRASLGDLERRAAANSGALEPLAPLPG